MEVSTFFPGVDVGDLESIPKSSISNVLRTFHAVLSSDYTKLERSQLFSLHTDINDLLGPFSSLL